MRVWNRLMLVKRLTDFISFRTINIVLVNSYLSII